MIGYAILLIILGGLGLAWSIYMACNHTNSVDGAFFTGLCGVMWLGTSCYFAQSLLQKI